MSTSVSFAMNAAVLDMLEMPGFDDEFVMGCDLLDETFEVAVRVMPRVSHTDPVTPARRPSPQEVAVVVAFLFQRMAAGTKEDAGCRRAEGGEA